MPLIGTKGAASAQGFGFVRLSAAGGYYYVMATETQYYQPQFNGVQPLSSGWMVDVTRPNDVRAKAILDSAGNLLSYRQDSSAITSPIDSMNRGGAAVFSGGVVPSWLGSGQDKLAFISSTPSYTGTPGNKWSGPPIGLRVLGIDYGANTVFSHGFYTDYEYVYQPAIASENATSGTSNWVQRWNLSTWEYPQAALIRPGDATNVWVLMGRASSCAILPFNKSTGAVGTGYAFSGASLGNSPPSFVADPSGNLYIGTTNGQIFKVNTSNTVDWAFVLSDSATGQNFGYTHMCYYDGYLYAIGSQHPNGNYLTRINPSDGSIDWAVKISTPLYGCAGVSASANGIMVVGDDNNSSGYKKSYLLNYPLAGGIIGAKGDFVFSNMTINRGTLSLTSTSVSGPALTSLSNPGTTSYSSSLNTATSIIGSKFVI